MAAVSNLTREEYRKYQDDMMARWDEYATKKTLLKQGWDEGKEKGRAQGILEGRAEGQAEMKKILVTNLLKSSDLSIAKISAVAEVSEFFVRKVKKELGL